MPESVVENSGIRVALLNDTGLDTPGVSNFEHWFDPVSRHLSVQGEICIKIVGRKESQDLNRTYRQQDKATNILSFPAEVPEEVGSDFLGDLAVCADIVELEAQAQAKSVKDHWAHLSIHGLLHLLGYDHVDAVEAEAMESLEIVLLKKLGIANPYRVL